MEGFPGNWKAFFLSCETYGRNAEADGRVGITKKYFVTKSVKFENAVALCS